MGAGEDCEGDCTGDCMDGCTACRGGCTNEEDNEMAGEEEGVDKWISTVDDFSCTVMSIIGLGGFEDDKCSGFCELDEFKRGEFGGLVRFSVVEGRCSLNNFEGVELGDFGWVVEVSVVEECNVVEDFSVVVELVRFGGFGCFGVIGRFGRSGGFGGDVGRGYGIEGEDGSASAVGINGIEAGEFTEGVVDLIELKRGAEVGGSALSSDFVTTGAESVASTFAIFVRRPGISFTITTWSSSSAVVTSSIYQKKKKNHCENER